MLLLNEKSSKDFALSFINFLKKFIGCSSASLRELAELQKKYPKEYQQFKDFQKDPARMMELFEKMDSNIKARLLNILFSSISLSQKINVDIFNLNYKEQIQLAEEIEKFVKLTDKSFEEIKEILE